MRKPRKRPAKFNRVRSRKRPHDELDCMDETDADEIPESALGGGKK